MASVGIYWRGENVPPDKEKAVQLVYQAAKQGVLAAHVWIAEALGSSGRPDFLGRALFHFTIAAELARYPLESLVSRRLHEERARVAELLSSADTAKWFELGISWKPGEELFDEADIRNLLEEAENSPAAPREIRSFSPPLIAGRMIDGCLKSSIIDPTGQRACDVGQYIADQFCRDVGFQEAVSFHPVDTGRSQPRSVKLLVEPGEGLSLKSVWAHDGGSNMMDRIECR